MKKAGISSVVFPLLLLIVNPAFAGTTIKTGDSTAEVHVVNSVEGTSTNNSTSNIHTHIEVETNGEKKVLDEDGPGNYSVTSNSGGGESSVNVTTNTGDQTSDDTSTKSADKDSKDSKDKDKEEEHVTPVSFIVNLFVNVGGFFLRIVRNL